MEDPSNIKEFFCIFEKFFRSQSIHHKSEKLQTLTHSQSILHTLANIHLK